MDEAPFEFRVARSPIGVVEHVDGFEESALAFQRIDGVRHIRSLQPCAHRIAASLAGIATAYEAIGVASLVAIGPPVGAPASEGSVPFDVGVRGLGYPRAPDPSAARPVDPNPAPRYNR
jgi:hypothetical protein